MKLTNNFALMQKKKNQPTAIQFLNAQNIYLGICWGQQLYNQSPIITFLTKYIPFNGNLKIIVCFIATKNGI